ncbi:hypothetical protein H920_14176 [Fukomys damarensis]|uniref:Uncharacterized protein n=1 Tax=Fukomys damarensis TaxID=885580 RepID=A0A091D2J3_FUKDA|nr:hypothetical protein H920_14176 [Fukomys damarensis]
MRGGGGGGGADRRAPTVRQDGTPPRSADTVHDPAAQPGWGPGGGTHRPQLPLQTTWGGSNSGFPLRSTGRLPQTRSRRKPNGKEMLGPAVSRSGPQTPGARPRVPDSHAPGRRTPALPDGAGPSLIAAPKPSLSLPARVSRLRTSRVSPRSYQGKGKLGLDGWLEKPPDWEIRSCGRINRQSTFSAFPG